MVEVDDRGNARTMAFRGNAHVAHVFSLKTCVWGSQGPRVAATPLGKNRLSLSHTGIQDHTTKWGDM